jgi:NAD(P)H-hydrate epimerase
MQPVLTPEQTRTFDGAAIEAGVPGLVLMENAARGALEVVLELWGDVRRVLVLAGGGNNGGDAYALARLLRTRGVAVEVFGTTPVEQLRGDAALQARAWLATDPAASVRGAEASAVGEALERTELVVDGLLGTGADRPVSGALATLIEAINGAGRPVLALDVPSGLDAERGRVLGIAVRASATVTFGHHKRGLLTTAGRECCGRLLLRDIGVPRGAFPWTRDGVGSTAGLPAGWLLEESDIAAWLEPRSPIAHKGSSGRVAIVAGAPGRIGAARLAARGALRAGAGLVTIATRPEAAQQLELTAFEEMTARLRSEDPGSTLEQLGPDVCVVGPGLGLDAPAQSALAAVLERPEPVVLDADALHLLTLETRHTLGPGPRVLTPHPGEAGRLLRRSAQEVEEDRFGAAQELAERHGAVIVLKGPHTIVTAPGEVPRVSPWGTSLLATGGTGDVLAGVLGAFLVSLTPLEAACVAVAVHGASGAEWARTAPAITEYVPDRGVLAREIADGVPHSLARFLAARS